jgi:hypothetical protein
MRCDDSEVDYLSKLWNNCRSKHGVCRPSAVNNDAACEDSGREHDAAATYALISRHVNCFLNRVVEDTGKRDPRFSSYVLPAGSVFENTKVEDSCDEFDFMFVLDSLNAACTALTWPLSPPGYVTLTNEDPSYADLLFDSSNVLDTRRVMFRFEVLLKQVLDDPEFLRNNDGIEPFIDINADDSNTHQFAPNNIATHFQIRFMKPIDGQFVLHAVSIDVVPSMCMKNWWPQDAVAPDRWIRGTFHDSGSLGNGCYLIFDQPQRKQPWVPWSYLHARVCFSQYESRIILSSRPVMRTACVVVKQIIKSFCHVLLFKSYVIKASLLHCMVDEMEDDRPPSRSVTDIVDKHELVYCFIS